MLEKVYWALKAACKKLRFILFCDVAPKYWGVHCYHPTGVVIPDKAVIGKNLTVYSNVVIGKVSKDDSHYPVIGDNVIIYANSVVVGNISVGDNAIIGANCVINFNVPTNAIVTCKNTHYIREQSTRAKVLNNTLFSRIKK